MTLLVRDRPPSLGVIAQATACGSLLALDLARNAPGYVALLIPFFFASRLGLIVSD